MHCFFNTAIYEEMEDDGLGPAFSPIAIQRKLDSPLPSTSQDGELVIKKALSTTENQTEV